LSLFAKTFAWLVRSKISHFKNILNAYKHEKNFALFIFLTQTRLNSAEIKHITNLLFCKRHLFARKWLAARLSRAEVLSSNPDPAKPDTVLQTARQCTSETQAAATESRTTRTEIALSLFFRQLEERLLSL